MSEVDHMFVLRFPSPAGDICMTVSIFLQFLSILPSNLLTNYFSPECQDNSLS